MFEGKSICVLLVVCEGIKCTCLRDQMDGRKCALMRAPTKTTARMRGVRNPHTGQSPKTELDNKPTARVRVQQKEQKMNVFQNKHKLSV